MTAGVPKITASNEIFVGILISRKFSTEYVAQKIKAVAASNRASPLSKKSKPGVSMMVVNGGLMLTCMSFCTGSKCASVYPGLI